MKKSALNIGVRKIFFFVWAAWIVAFCLSNPLSAQTLYTVSGDQLINGGGGSTNAQPNLKVTGTGGVLFGGTFGQGSIPAEGAGTRMMWYPKKGAFRVGGVLVIDMEGHRRWDDAYIGNYSFAAGKDTAAYGEFSTALGYGSGASGTASVAMGSNASASGYCSIALGSSCFAQGDYSVALGLGSVWGYGAFATGGGAAEGNFSIALGSGASAKAYGSVALGTLNTLETPISKESPVPSDVLFIVGNGYTIGEDDYRSNALSMRRNANMRIGGKIEAKGVIRCAAGGDLSMGAFTSGQNPATLDNALKYSGE